MTTFIFIQQALVTITATIAWIVFYTNGQIQLPGGSSHPLYSFRELECKFIVAWHTSVPTRTLISCAMLCKEGNACSVFHYLEHNSSCVIETRPANTIVVDATPGDNSWASYFGYKHACDSTWTQFDDSCYHVPHDLYSWTECHNYCQMHLSHLATIRSAREMDFALGIVKILPLDYKFLHLGGQENPHDHTWSWINGEPWDYTRWGPDEPSSHTEQCLAVFPFTYQALYGLYDWNDLPCTTSPGYCLCEKLAIKPPSECMPEEK